MRGTFPSMLTAKLVPQGVKVVADPALRGGAFACPKCREDVTLKAGRIVAAHFAHRAMAVCDWAGESAVHLKTKLAIRDAVAADLAARGVAQNYDLDLEHDLGPVRPDVWLRGRTTGRQVGVEVQASALTAESILERTARYRALCAYVLWVVPFDPARFLKTGRDGVRRFAEVRLKTYERIVAQMGFKTLLAWDLSGTFPPGFLALKLSDTWGADSEFYAEGGELQSFSGRRRKTVKRVEKHRAGLGITDLDQGFARRFQGRGMTYALPERLMVGHRWGA